MAETTVTLPTRILVFGMAHEDGTVLASELYPAAEGCGQSTEQVRSCLRRLVQQGLFAQDGGGRTARYRATAAGLTELGITIERHRLAYAQDQAGKGWDRRWRLVAFAVPEARRAARDALRDRLVALGGAPVQKGLYVSPHRWDNDITEAAKRLDLADHVTLASTDDLEVGGVRDPRALAARLWPTDDLAVAYQRFVDDYAEMPKRLEEMRRQHRRIPDAMFLPGALAMGVAFNGTFERDPLLPPELLPRPWPGRTARELVLRSRRLALLLRETHDRPLLFRAFDEMLESIP
ncbi:MAG: PaaX family transcriptional regulator C-terminal domain-containing protein [Acidimicrobiales bacterium]